MVVYHKVLLKQEKCGETVLIIKKMYFLHKKP